MLIIYVIVNTNDNYMIVTLPEGLTIIQCFYVYHCVSFLAHPRCGSTSALSAGSFAKEAKEVARPWRKAVRSNQTGFGKCPMLGIIYGPWMYMYILYDDISTTIYIHMYTLYIYIYIYILYVWKNV